VRNIFVVIYSHIIWETMRRAKLRSGRFHEPLLILPAPLQEENLPNYELGTAPALYAFDCSWVRGVDRLSQRMAGGFGFMDTELLIH
jgi:hypothetical protein